MRKVLFIAYYFPPIGGSGTQRPLKFVKYLPQFGWQPYVISTDRPYGEGSEGRDETLLADIPSGVQVWREPTPQPQPVQRLARWVGWQSAAARADNLGTEGEVPLVSPELSFIKRVRRTLLAPLYLVEKPPVDAALYWALRIVPLARRIIEQEGIDVIFTTVPPWSALLTGALLRRLTGRPWVADFRDPWTDNTFTYFPTPRRRWLDERLERRLLNRADAVISVTVPWLQGLRRRAARSQRDKPFALIPNGWDQDDFPGLLAVAAGLAPPASNNGRIVLLHPGSAYQGEPLPLLRALERLGPQIREQLRFRFIGYLHPLDRAQIQQSPYANCFVLDSQRVPHPEALQLMSESHILLLLLRKGPGASSGKIFEYMVAGRPVLAIGTGVAEQLVKQCGIGLAVHPEDADGLAAALRRAVEDYGGLVESYYRPNWVVIGGFERRVLAAKLAETLDTVRRHS